MFSNLLNQSNYSWEMTTWNLLTYIVLLYEQVVENAVTFKNKVYNTRPDVGKAAVISQSVLALEAYIGVPSWHNHYIEASLWSEGHCNLCYSHLQHLEWLAILLRMPTGMTFCFSLRLWTNWSPAMQAIYFSLMSVTWLHSSASKVPAQAWCVLADSLLSIKPDTDYVTS